MTIPSDLDSLLPALLAAWDRGAVLSAAVPAAGTVNRTLLLATTTGEYALRAYRHRDREPVEREHAVIAHVRAHGLPAVAPLPLPGGETILERDGRYYALFPRAPGRQYRKADLSAEAAAAMGGFLARLHRALADFPPERAARRPFALDRAATLAGIARLERAIAARPAREPRDAVALTWLRGQRAWLEQAPPAAGLDLAGLAEQTIHGDYQESNLFFADGEVSAIIDWDQTYIAPPAWEVVRACHLAFGFAPASCRRFLAAYRAVAPLPPADLDHAAREYGLLRAHDLWVFETYYLAGDARVRPFLPAGDFVPLAERWAELRSALPPHERTAVSARVSEERGA